MPDETPPCKHEWVFSHTVEDWYDGDEDDVYVCTKCGARKSVYIPR